MAVKPHTVKSDPTPLVRPKVLKIKDVLEITGYRSPVSIWNLERQGKFPKRRQIGPNSVGWICREIEEFLESRPVVKLSSSKT